MFERLHPKFQDRFLKLAALAGMLVLAHTGPARSENICTPALAIRDAKFSDVRDSHRVWSATLTADPARCTVTSGRFELAFVRLLENGPDLEFAEALTWTPGESSIAVTFGQSEAVLSYRIRSVAPCTCRN